MLMIDDLVLFITALNDRPVSLATPSMC